MKRFGFLAVATVLAFTLPALAQQKSAPTPAPLASAPVEQHLKALSDKLSLTADQQEKARPILQEMHDSAEKIMEDTGLSQDEKMAQMKPVYENADKQLRAFLTDEQKNKLDAMEQAHPEFHGNGSR